MITSRRDALSRVTGRCDNAGLTLDRYCQGLGDDSQAVRDLHKLVANAQAPACYQDAFQRWASALAGVPGRFVVAATLTGPLAIGLGNESVSEVGLTTNHTYGTPIVRGSAIKGACVRGFRQWAETTGLNKDQQAPYRAMLFGTTDSASHLMFWDAWFRPGTAAGKPYMRDTVTVHHPNYYSKRGADHNWPTDFDDPNPVPFLVVRPGAGFLFPVDCPEGWAGFTRSLLAFTLTRIGLGGKTNAGYGFFRVDEASPPPTGARETWEGCTLERRNLKPAGFNVIARNAEGRVVEMSQSEWAKLGGDAIAKQHKEALAAGKLLGDLEIEISGSTPRVVALKPRM